ncbi:aminoglycoside phosphotransferase family protein [Staphylospora marina]|uniref:aminoglycoside phosphotransferase family protein n=1 Tax=Staphylospora marina TaxID=2490858 RepID=UPI0013DDE140|nr:aminoglycoside phosphotransferase family protein [Staphylospora marina]
MKPPRRQEMERMLGTSVVAMEPFRKNWLVKTGAGAYVAKRADVSHLRWWMNVDRELRMRGFHDMPPMTLGSGWMITPYLRGRPGKYTEESTVSRMMEILARFHLTGRGLVTPPADGAAFLLHRRIHDRLVRFWKALGKAGSVGGELGAFLARTGPDFYRDGLAAWERLRKLPLNHLAKHDRYFHAVTHRDLASHNWIISEDGRIWLIDFETADYDAQVGDVWQIISRVLAENAGAESWLKLTVDSYERIRPLPSVERTILVELLAFPNEFFREAVGLVERKRGYKPEHSLPYLKKLAEHRSAFRSVLRNLSLW